MIYVKVSRGKLPVHSLRQTSLAPTLPARARHRSGMIYRRNCITEFMAFCNFWCRERAVAVPALLAQDEARMSEDGYDSANALLNSFGAKLNFVACVD
jgi:hypothetical protein